MTEEEDIVQAMFKAYLVTPAFPAAVALVQKEHPYATVRDCRIAWEAIDISTVHDEDDEVIVRERHLTSP